MYSYDDENHLIETATLKAGGARSTDNAQYNRFGEVAQKGVDGVYATHIDYDLAGRVWRSNTQGYYQSTRVVTTFPSVESCLRLITGVLIEIDEAWVSGSMYINMNN